jgi:hypothetical protein
MAQRLDPSLQALFNLSENVPRYLPDDLFRTLACIDQMRICPSRDGEPCSLLTGPNGVKLSALNLSRKQEATADRIIEARDRATIWDAVNQLGNTALMANDILLKQWSPGLPANQWMWEVDRWFQTLMAYIQIHTTEFPNNQWHIENPELPRPQPASEWRGGTSDAMEQLCHSQLVRSTNDYQSFSLAGILIVVVLSATVISTSWLLEPCIFRLRSRQPNGRKRYKRVAHSEDGKLQLLRRILQAAGYGGWHNKLENAPYRPPRDPFHQKDIEPSVEEDDNAMNTVHMYDMDSAYSQRTSVPSTFQPYESPVASTDYQTSYTYDRMRRPSPASFSYGPPAYVDDNVPLFGQRGQSN